MSVLRGGFWVLHFLGLTVATFWMAWWLLTPLDFGYRLGYQLLDINAHISEFAPQNLYRHGYEQTTESDHFAHFHAIVSAINAGGDGLADISYQADQVAPQTLLHKAEVIHLQDVANLVALFHVAGPLMLLLWVTTLGWAYYKRWAMPTPQQMLAGGITVLVMSGAILLLMGPTAVFYWLHTHIFPEDHQWFFYYQESLMTTLMKAPDLFGYIALLWAGASVIMMLAFSMGARKMTNICITRADTKATTQEKQRKEGNTRNGKRGR